MAAKNGQSGVSARKENAEEGSKEEGDSALTGSTVPLACLRNRQNAM